MDKTEKLNKKVTDGVRAGLELDRTNKAFDDLETLYVDAWKNTNAKDDDARNRLWQAVQILQKVRTHLHQQVADGKIAAADLRRLSGEKSPILGLIKRS